MTTKTKSIAHCHINFPLLSFVKGKVKRRVYALIYRTMVNGGRHQTMLHRKDGGNGLNGTGRAQ